jgi:hypothetical protein
MQAHTAHAQQTHDLDKMPGAKKVYLDRKEWDLDLCEAALVVV